VYLANLFFPLTSAVGGMTFPWYSSLLEWLLEEIIDMIEKKPFPLLHFGPKVAH
jgi:hypothetical protein